MGNRGINLGVATLPLGLALPMGLASWVWGNEQELQGIVWLRVEG